MCVLTKPYMIGESMDWCYVCTATFAAILVVLLVVLFMRLFWAGSGRFALVVRQYWKVVAIILASLLVVTAVAGSYTCEARAERIKQDQKKLEAEAKKNKAQQRDEDQRAEDDLLQALKEDRLRAGYRAEAIVRQKAIRDANTREMQKLFQKQVADPARATVKAEKKTTPTPAPAPAPAPPLTPAPALSTPTPAPASTSAPRKIKSAASKDQRMTGGLRLECVAKIQYINRISQEYAIRVSDRALIEAYGQQGAYEMPVFQLPWEKGPYPFGQRVNPMTKGQIYWDTVFKTLPDVINERKGGTTDAQSNVLDQLLAAIQSIRSYPGGYLAYYEQCGLQLNGVCIQLISAVNYNLDEMAKKSPQFQGLRLSSIKLPTERYYDEIKKQLDTYYKSQPTHPIIFNQSFWWLNSVFFYRQLSTYDKLVEVYSSTLKNPNGCQM